ncbi:MAG TPA: Gmad2 immunoglobulin-like domain-containing protein, partial [Acidimicrobiales bacterium]|nr:Gmad2 immunoglobulin-like domain-containing protein [Acidimicrobiales bacterium]
VGFTNPVYGEFQGGDSRSGEVEVRAQADGPVTTLAVRQMSDDNWYVLAALTDQIDVTAPAPGTAIDNPLQVAGQAQAFEGTVRVVVYGRGVAEPLGEGFVTGSGGEMGPFSGDITWDNPGGGWGFVLFVIDSAEDGSPWQAAALPVGFIGGD